MVHGTSFWLRATLFLMRLSNIADLPSRGKYELLERLGARGVYYVPLVGTTDWNAPLTNWIERGARDEYLLRGRRSRAGEAETHL